jgi:uncharacterized protein (DUF736 family)
MNWTAHTGTYDIDSVQIRPVLDETQLDALNLTNGPDDANATQNSPTNIIVDSTFDKSGTWGDYWIRSDASYVVFNNTGGEDGGRAVEISNSATPANGNEYIRSPLTIGTRPKGKAGDKFLCRIKLWVDSASTPTFATESDFRVEAHQFTKDDVGISDAWPNFVGLEASAISALPGYAQDTWITAEGIVTLEDGSPSGDQPDSFEIYVVAGTSLEGMVKIDTIELWKIPDLTDNTQQDWNDVSGTGIPDDNADVTSANPQNLDWIANLNPYTAVNHLYVRGSQWNLSPDAGIVMIDGVDKAPATTVGLTLVVFKKSDHSVVTFSPDGLFATSKVAVKSYDYVTPDDRPDLTAALSELRTNTNSSQSAGYWGGDIIIVLVSDDNWQTGGANGIALATEMKLHGASASIDAVATRTPYILIGGPGVGESNGIEVFGEDDAADGAYAEYNGMMVNGSLSGLGTAGDRTADQNIAPTQFIPGNLSVAFTIIGGGEIVMNAAGAIRSTTKDNYADTDAGFFMGYDSGAYKLYFGDATDYMKWDGTNLEITGNVYARKYIKGTGIASDFEVMSNTGGGSEESEAGTSWTTKKSFRITRYGTLRVEAEVKRGSGTVVTYPQWRLVQGATVIGTAKNMTSDVYGVEFIDITIDDPDVDVDLQTIGGEKTGDPTILAAWIKNVYFYNSFALAEQVLGSEGGTVTEWWN